MAGNDHAELRRLLPHPKADLVRQARDLMARRVEEKMAGVRFELIAAPDGDRQLVLRYRPMRLTDAIWQRFAEEISGAFACARCPAPKCGRWFLRNGGRSDRRHCSQACRMRAWRRDGR